MPKSVVPEESRLHMTDERLECCPSFHTDGLHSRGCLYTNLMSPAADRPVENSETDTVTLSRMAYEQLWADISRLREANARLVEANRDRISEFTAAEAEVSRLRADRLTREEATLASAAVEAFGNVEMNPVLTILYKKLRRISGSGSQ